MAAKTAQIANLDQASLVNLFAVHGLDCNLVFLTGRPSDVEQKRHFFNLRADIADAIFEMKNEDIYIGMSAQLGDQSMDMLNVVQRESL